VNVNTLEQVAAKTLELNAIGVCNLKFDQSIPVDATGRTPRPADSS